MARLNSIRLLRRFAQLDYGRRLLLGEALVGLVAARFALLFLSFPRLARRLGTLVLPSDPRVLETEKTVSPGQGRVAEDIGWAVTRAARYAPFNAVCLPQAITAHTMLRRRGVASVMHFGAAMGESKPLDTHVWLDAAGVEVTGYPLAARLAEIACFV
jgi:hypothetical protein